MSEYQYYEFAAIDRPLGQQDQQALRDLSTRARITATSFTNTYEWGDFKGDPAELMERWFDLHLYLANWGTRRFMIRLPKRLVDPKRLDGLVHDVECADLLDAGDNLILDILRDLEDLEDWDDGSGQLASLAPLRADVLQGDLRLFYLLWLMMVEEEVFDADEPEPMPGLGPMTASLEAFADFFYINPDLVEAAAERPAAANASAISPDAVTRAVAAMSDREKTEMLVRVFDGDPHAALELRAAILNRLAPEIAAPPAAPRTAGDLRARADAIRGERERVEAEQALAEQKRRAAAAEKARRARLDEIARRGERIWNEIETEIARSNATGYDNAAGLLSDLQAIAKERATLADFNRRLSAIRQRHAAKRRFIERLQRMK